MSKSDSDVTGRPPRAPADEQWRAMLTNPSAYRTTRRLFGRLPTSPRCKSCAAPFGGLGGIVMRRLGRGPWSRNPKYCENCFRLLRDNHGGAEIECSLLFADVRGSTPLAERLQPREVARLMGRFYDAATAVLVERGAYVDKFVGDEVVGIFVPAMATDRHAAQAIDAAREVLRATGHGSPSGPWLPIGASVNTGTAYVGAIGEGANTELGAIGDAVNTAARLASAAAAGEVLVTESAATSAGLSMDGLERRSLDLKGKSVPTEVVVISVR